MGRIAAILVIALLTGCGSVTFFGNRNDSQELGAGPDGTIPLVAQVLSLTVDQTPGGVIVSAVGLPPTQGFWDANLVPVASEDPSVLVLDFYLATPITPNPVGTQPSREVLAGAFLSRQELEGIRTIAVQGALNRRSVSRQ